MVENDISYAIRGAAFKVHTALGPGLLESVYETALAFELTRSGYTVRTQVGIPVIYDSEELGWGFKLDLIVNETVIIEIKSVEAIAPVHYKQLLTYLRLSNKKLGLLINFNSSSLTDSIKKVANGL
ncbi:MAG TPA: GxxExxY protein [Bacteroidia bacterium]|nr:GxxExxY protein [Bacteroidia bacterium]